MGSKVNVVGSTFLTPHGFSSTDDAPSVPLGPIHHYSQPTLLFKCILFSKPLLLFEYGFSGLEGILGDGQFAPEFNVGTHNKTTS